MQYAPRPFQHIYLVNDKLERYTPETFIEIEEAFGIQFPPLQKIFLHTLGKGVYCNHVRIHAPQEILANNQERPRNAEIDPLNGSVALSPERIRTSIIIADSIEGDQIVLLPDEPEKLYVLLRGYGYRKVCAVPRGFLDLMLWVDAEGRFESASSFPYFTSWNERKEQWLQAVNNNIMLVEIIRHIEQQTNTQIKTHVSQCYEEGTSNEYFIPDIRGLITINESVGSDAQDIEISCCVEYDQDFESTAEEIIQAIRDLGFQ
jgi:hypothetical protein